VAVSVGDLAASFGDKAPAVDVIDVAVLVVVPPVARRLARVGPELPCQVAVAQIDPGVQDGDDDVGATGLQVPRAGRAYGSRPPLGTPVGVVGGERGLYAVIVLRNLDCRVVAESV
jgi:hypothetical protein